jgi:hypothetical protein
MSQMPPGTPPQVNYSTPPQRPSSGLAVAAMIVGIVSIFPGCCLARFGGMLVLGLVAVILGIMARNAAAAGRGGGGGMALTGIITGAIGLALGLLLLLLVQFGGPAIQNKINQILQQQKQQLQQQQQQQQNSSTSQGS